MAHTHAPLLSRCTVLGMTLIVTMMLGICAATPVFAQNMSSPLGGGFGAAGPSGMLTEKEMAHLIDRYPHCVGEPTYKSNGHYISPEGGLGWYQIRVHDAYRAGLCAKPVAAAPRSPRAWGLCDFKGPLANRFNIKHEFDFRYSKRGSDAQKIIFTDMVERFEAELQNINYIPPRTFEALQQQRAYTPDVMIGLMHLWGTVSTARMLKGDDIVDQNNRSAIGTANCLKQCLHNIFIEDLKCSL